MTRRSEPLESPTAIGLDLSLTRTGFAAVGPEGIDCSSFGRTGKTNESLPKRFDRIKATVNWIDEMIWDCTEIAKVAVIEDKPFGAIGGSAHDRSGLWWMTYELLTRTGIPVVAVNVAKVKVYATGRGTKLEKDEILLATVRAHPDAPIDNNDEADAVNLALIGARLIGEPADTESRVTHLRALDSIPRPEWLEVPF